MSSQTLSALMLPVLLTVFAEMLDAIAVMRDAVVCMRDVVVLDLSQGDGCREECYELVSNECLI